MYYDYIVIGAGFAGSVIAERIVNDLNKRVLIIEKRGHIGGNAFDCYDDHNLLIHRYGPHIFHTSNKEVWDYLSHFTDWELYQHKVKAYLDGNIVPIPFNLNTLYKLFPSQIANLLCEKLIDKFGFNGKVPILRLMKENDDQLSSLADYIYKKLFLNYTRKQWGVLPQDLDPSVTGRVPIHISRDNRYFQDLYQGIPKHGYSKLFENMLRHPNISILLNTNYKQILHINQNQEAYLFGAKFHGKIIYTGPIDYFFDYRFGHLPYRSLEFRFEHYNQDTFQEVGQVNYPNDYEFTRITEYKHLTGQQALTTTISKEFPTKYIPEKNIPYYPIDQSDNRILYKRYHNESKKYEQLIFVGRLAEYHYYDMHAVVAKALKTYRNKVKKTIEF
ncbi:UDP-galactopyranose mutase [Bacillus velezensis]|uniref:UDP-galactopyranose mutase n=2 Tax=Bacillus velezensis TaxID=492670 RepID=UPI000DC5BE0D|nr:UDP-galactopyranose mutase [Bacillus velezensis]MED3509508.1 UDP-galactopyranose mutase [Bacillus velezensis]RAP15250.1 UDP-galactopyranose mutase [Bacillus velezensis]